MNKELQIGEIGVIDGVKVQCLRVSEYINPCTRCAFEDTPASICMSLCIQSERSDQTDVYFKKIEE